MKNIIITNGDITKLIKDLKPEVRIAVIENCPEIKLSDEVVIRRYEQYSIADTNIVCPNTKPDYTIATIESLDDMIKIIKSANWEQLILKVSEDFPDIDKPMLYTTADTYLKTGRLGM